MDLITLHPFMARFEEVSVRPPPHLDPTGWCPQIVNHFVKDEGFRRQGEERRTWPNEDPRLLGWFAYTHRLWLVLEGKHHRLREVGYFGVWHDNTQDLLTQDLAGILVLDRRGGGGK